MLIKPEEMILHRPHIQGGIGLHSVRFKALAGFITTFLQTAVQPTFRTNLLHSLLYRKYVLEEADVPGVPTQPPPYFTQELFSMIKKVHEESTLNITTMTEKDWSRLLTEEYITMEYSHVTQQRVMIKCKTELDNPDTDWPMSWSLCRQPGVPPDLASFLWKLLLNLLPTQVRLQRMRISELGNCKHCPVPGTLQHELIDCDYNAGVGHALMTSIQIDSPGCTASQLLRLDFGNISEDKKLPTIILVATTLRHLWLKRASPSRVQAYQVRAELEQTINLLRTSRLSTVSDTLSTLKDQMFH